ncbi:MAG: alpha/beta hydrolase [Halioglobus sp.]
MKILPLVISTALLLGLISRGVGAEEAFGYKLTTDVVYGQGEITVDGLSTTRNLLIDVYQPVNKDTAGPLPAVILVHGGAFHRGGLRHRPYKEMGAVHSRMEDYARLLSPLGYVCFVVDYRLIPENPVPEMAPDSEELQPYAQALTQAGLKRTNFARSRMGLPPFKESERLKIWNGVLSAAEDLHKVVHHVRGSAEVYGIDPQRIALGGHSAGAATVLNAAYGLKSPVKAIFPLSPPVLGFDMKKVIDSPDLPPMLLISSQNDEQAVSEHIPSLISTVKQAGLGYHFAWVPGFGHFYPSGAVALGDDGLRMSLGERIAKFLEVQLN